MNEVNSQAKHEVIGALIGCVIGLLIGLQIGLWIGGAIGPIVVIVGAIGGAFIGAELPSALSKWERKLEPEPVKPSVPAKAEPTPAPPPPTETITEQPAPVKPYTEEGIWKRYELVREIGRGGMGIVYEAINKKLDKKVALKKMREELAINPREKKRFLSEAKRVAKLHHPHIVDIYDILEEENDIYLVFEFVDGKTVEQILNVAEKLELKKAIEIIKQVCEALNYAHSQRTIHRDIKPSNIIVDNNRWVKVMDFGIAREAKDTFSRLTGKDTSGTLAYMSPEQELGSYDERSDIFSLGICLYEMLIGDMPFRGPNFLAQKREMVYRKAKEIQPDIPSEMDNIINKCLQADKEKRYQAVTELTKELGVM